MHLRHRSWLAAVAASTLTVACGLGQSTPSSGTITIGIPAPMTGSNAIQGTQTVNGAKLAVEDVNKAGGVLGKKLSITVEDDACDSQTGVQAAEKLVQQHIVAAAGAICSGAAIPESGVFHTNGDLPVIFTQSTNPKLTEQGLDNVFRVVERDDDLAPFSALVLTDYLHAKRVALLHDNTVYAKTLADLTRGAIQKLGTAQVVYFDALTPGQSDYTSVLTKVASVQPDVLYFTGYFAESGLLLKQRQQLGLKFQIVLGDIADQQIFATAGASADGTLFTSGNIAQFLSSATPFSARYKQVFGDAAGISSPYVYDAVRLLAKAINDANSTKASDIIRQLRSVADYPGITGSIAFDNKGDRKDIQFIILEARNQQFTPVATLQNGKWIPWAG